MRPPHPPSPGSASVVVLGEALVDVWPDGTQISGGAPFNVARWLAAFGVPTLFITRLGSGDAAASLLRAEMARFGLRQHGVQSDDAYPTGQVKVVPDPQGHRFEIAHDSAWDHLDAGAALPLVKLAAARTLCFGSLALRHADSRAAIVQCLQSTPALRVLDLNLRDVPGLQALAEQALQLADWVKVNDDELGRLLVWFVDATEALPAPGSAALSRALAALSQRFDIQRWIVTRGAQGWFTAGSDGCIDAEGPAQSVPDLRDTVGAGDAFTAAVVAGLARNRPLAVSLAAANRLAAAVCGWRGALPADDATVRRWRDNLGFGSAAAGPHP